MSLPVILTVLASTLIPYVSANGCGQTEPNCFPSPRDVAPFASANASTTCGIFGILGFETYSFGDITNRPEIPRVDGLVCDGADPNNQHNASNINDRNSSTWWQAPHFITDVTLQLNWPNGFRILDLAIEHRSVRPSRATLEYSRDNGLTWNFYQYYSINCQSNSNGFPGIPVAQAQQPDDRTVFCISQQSGSDPEDRGMVTFDPQFRASPTGLTMQSTIDSYLVITNLRFRMDRLFTLSIPENIRNTPETRRYYYAVYDWRVNGTCNCYGHSDSCRAAPGDVFGFATGCSCDHRTAGTNCERCEPLYNNRLWAPGTVTNANECQLCNCSNHATSCTFNPTIGFGTCDNCADNTAGNNCEVCASGFYADMTMPSTAAAFCLPCDCNSTGTVANTVCTNDFSGQCVCKTNTQGRQCNMCRERFFNLQATNNLGCDPCECSASGSTPAGLICDGGPGGQCGCKANVQGRTCNECKDGFYNLQAGNPDGCQPCLCDCGGSMSPVCDKALGTCPCWSFVTGRTCNAPIANYYFPDFDWLRIEAEVFSQPSAAQIQLMTNPFPVGDFTGQGVVLYPSGVTAVYTLTARSPAIPAEYNAVSCRTNPANIVMASVTGSVVSFRTIAPGTVDSCIVFISAPTCTSPNQALVETCRNHRVSQPTNCTDVINPACEALTFSTVTDVWNQTLACDCTGIGAIPGQPCKMYGGQCPCQPGVQGRTCNECIPGFYQLSNTGCLPCACVAAGSTSQVCDQVSGQCPCLPNVDLRTCGRCLVNHYDFGNPAGCLACNCSADFSVSQQCDNMGVCTCFRGVGGDKCTECLPDFHTLTAGVGCTGCGCDVRGTLTNRTCNATTSLCPCKANAMGSTCSMCRPGTFGLSIRAPDGCFECVCSGKPEGGLPMCTSAANYRLVERRADFSVNQDGFTFSGVFRIFQSIISSATSLRVLEFRYDGLSQTDTRAYVAPAAFRSGLRRALGLDLVYSLSTEAIGGSTPTPMSGLFPAVTIGSDVPGTPLLVAALPAPMPATLTEFRVPLSPSTGVWRIGDAQGPAATLQQMVTVLQSVNRFEVLATGYLNVANFPGLGVLFSGSLHTFRLEEATLSNNLSFPLVRSVEDCTCPAAYMGLSCERCSVQTHSRNFDLRSIAPATTVNAFDNCTLCECNGHSTRCDEVTGICIACEDRTTGDHCELCADVNFGDATLGSNGCMPCDCNSTGSANLVCNRATGQCPCRPNVEGRQCNMCSSTTFQFSNMGCINCGCNVNGSVASTCNSNDCNCDLFTGQCSCQDNVEGLKCTQCRFGTFGVPPRCTVCHECFLDWFNIIQRLSVLVEEQDNRTTEALRRAFGDLTADQITSTLATIGMKLDSAMGLLGNRMDVALERELLNLEAVYNLLNLRFTRTTIEIDQTAQSLNISMSRLPFIQSFNGTVRVFDNVITAAGLSALSNEQTQQINNITATADNEVILLGGVTDSVTASATSARASQAIAMAAGASAMATLTIVATVDGRHAEYTVLYQANQNYLNTLRGSVTTLEGNAASASTIISMAYQVVLQANQTIYQARTTAVAKLVEVRQFLADVNSLAQQATETYQSAANTSRVANAVQAAVQQGYRKVRMSLDTLTQINASLMALNADLTQARNAAQMVQSLSTPSQEQVALVRNLSQQINASIVPQSVITATLNDAEQALRDSMAILATARAAYNASSIALAMVTEIQSELTQITTLTSTVNTNSDTIRANLVTANISLHQTLQNSAQVVSILTQQIAIINNVITPRLQMVEMCQTSSMAQYNTLQTTAARICSTIVPAVTAVVSSAEAFVSRLGANVTAQSQLASDAALAASAATSAADQLRSSLDLAPRASTITTLLTDYIQLRMDIQSSEVRAMGMESELTTILADLQNLQARCL